MKHPEPAVRGAPETTPEQRVEPPTRERVLDDGSREWSRRIVAWDDRPETYRLCVTADGGAFDGFVSIADVSVTSKSETAERVEGPEETVVLTVDDARWLLAHLPLAIAEAEKRRGGTDV